MSIPGPRIRLTAGATAIRPFSRRDAAELLERRRDSREHLAPWEPARSDAFFTLQAQRHLLEGQAAAWAADSGYAFAILDTTRADRLAGGVNLSNITRGAWANCTIGYWLASDATGRGHATRAVRLAVTFALRHADLHRVQAAVIPRNTPSQGVVRRAGLRREGLAERYLRIAGVWEDHEIFAVTSEEWPPASPPP